MKDKINGTNRIEMTFQNLPENERIGRTLAAAFASVLDPSMEELSDFKTAVSEAVTNAIIHAYPETQGDIIMVFERENNVVRVHKVSAVTRSNFGQWVYDHRTVLKYGAIVLVVIAVVVAGFMALF